MGKVIAICTSKHKGTLKNEVAEANLIEEFGIEGDAHAGKWHRQVSLLALEKIEDFRNKGGNVDFGAFGENLVIEGFELNKLPIGQRLTVGDEVLLEVTQIGKECHDKCAIYYQVGECIMPKNGILIIEGIHGLNPILTSSLDENNIFKIYISALTQLNLDNHNRISTSDVRRVRRIVRDSLSRGKNAEETLLMWPSIKKGEEKNIFVYQEEADVMFNSTLVYELCVLKKKALEELDKVVADSSVYDEVKRLKAFLGFFDEIDKGLVPENSILREFIGGSKIVD